jgi:hypothetical protein
MNDRLLFVSGVQMYRDFIYLQANTALFLAKTANCADMQHNNFHFYFPAFAKTFIWQAFLGVKTVEK